MHGDQHVTSQNGGLSWLRRTEVRVILTVLACAIPVVPLLLLVQNNFDSAGFEPLGNPATTLSPPRDDYYGTPTEVYSANGYGTSADFCVTFEFLGLNPSAPDVSLGILVGVTSAGESELSTLAAEGYREVSVVVKSDSGLSNFEIPIPTSVLAGAPITPCGPHPLQMNLDQDAAYRATWTPSLLGQPRAFPQDWYELDDSVGVIAGHSQNGQALPSSLVMMSRDEDLRVGAQIDQGYYQNASYLNLPGTHQLFFTVHRPPWVITYTYWVAAMPFLLLVALLCFKRFGQRSPLEPGRCRVRPGRRHGGHPPVAPGPGAEHNPRPDPPRPAVRPGNLLPGGGLHPLGGGLAAPGAESSRPSRGRSRRRCPGGYPGDGRPGG